MNRQTSIALHLARVIGKEHCVHTYPDGKSQAVLLCFDDGRKQMWWPENNLHQWAECVLWAAMNGCWPDVMATRVSYDAIESRWIGYVPHDGTTEGIQAATLEAIARATGWEESK